MASEVSVLEVNLTIDMPNVYTISAGESIFLAPNIFTNTDELTFLWTSDYDITDATGASITVGPLEDTYFYVEVDNGCSASDSTLIVVTQDQPLIRLPNAFSPNGDGVNDVFRILEVGGIIESTNMWVYNRWGELLWSGDGRNVGWDGTYKGEPQEMGAYLFYVEYTALSGEVEPIYGNVTLIR